MAMAQVKIILAYPEISCPDWILR